MFKICCLGDCCVLLHSLNVQNKFLPRKTIKAFLIYLNYSNKQYCDCAQPHHSLLTSDGTHLFQLLLVFTLIFDYSPEIPSSSHPGFNVLILLPLKLLDWVHLQGTSMFLFVLGSWKGKWSSSRTHLFPQQKNVWQHATGSLVTSQLA